ncbi:MAG: hypothetical protein ACYTG7_02665 [Planctomycetota bacterium]|jgi:hypothetical protein
MNLDLITGIRGGKPGMQPFSDGFSLDRHLAIKSESGIFRAMDKLEVSEAARQAYDEEGLDQGAIRSLMERFRLALVQFTNYVKRDIGLPGPADGMDGYFALAELARRSGIEMPENLNQGREDLLAAFKDQWGLDDGSSVDDIFQTMVQVFNEEPALAQNDVPTVETVPRGEGSVENDIVPPVEDAFRQALVQFTTRLLYKNEDSTVPGQTEYDRVLTRLAENLGLPAAVTGVDYSGIARELGVNGSHNVEEIVRMMSRVFFA